MDKNLLNALWHIRKLRRGLVVAVVGLLVFFHGASRFVMGHISFWQSPYTVAMVGGVALLSLAVVLLLQSVPERVAVEGVAEEVPPDPTTGDKRIGMALLILLSLLYLNLLTALGFLIASAGYVYGLLFLAGERRQRWLAFTAVSMSAVCYLTLLVAGVPLP